MVSGKRWSSSHLCVQSTRGGAIQDREVWKQTHSDSTSNVIAISFENQPNAISITSECVPSVKMYEYDNYVLRNQIIVSMKYTKVY